MLFHFWSVWGRTLITAASCSCRATFAKRPNVSQEISLWKSRLTKASLGVAADVAFVCIRWMLQKKSISSNFNPGLRNNFFFFFEAVPWKSEFEWDLSNATARGLSILGLSSLGQHFSWANCMMICLEVAEFLIEVTAIITKDQVMIHGS